MITVTVIRTDAQVRGLKAAGHARTLGEEFSLPCAAASVLLRTAARTLETAIPIDGGASEPGVLELNLGQVPENRREWARGVLDTTITGLLDLTREFPGEVRLDLLDSEGEHRYGT